MLIVDRRNRACAPARSRHWVPLAAGVLAWPELPWSGVGAVLTSASIIVVALNAQLRRRVDLRPNEA